MGVANVWYGGDAFWGASLIFYFQGVTLMPLMCVHACVLGLRYFSLMVICVVSPMCGAPRAQREIRWSFCFGGGWEPDLPLESGFCKNAERKSVTGCHKAGAEVQAAERD